MSRRSLVAVLLAGLLAPLTAASQPPAPAHPGRNLIIAVEGRRLSKQQEAFLAEFQPGGVVLLGGNISGRGQTLALTQAVKRAVGGGAGLADYPLVYVDQEGGRINRLRLDGAPSAAALGRLNDGEAARETGAVFAREAAARGIGVVLAPVLDLCPAGSGGVIGDRSFGEDPALVWGMARAFSLGVNEGGALPVGKHFPGHGAAEEDSHKRLARLRLSGEALERTLAPFRLAVEAGLPAIMVGHIACAALDPENPDTPASLSAAMVTGLLRKTWGYDGLVITDDLNMKAVTGSLPEATVQSLRAGCDAVMVCDPDIGRLRKVVSALEEEARREPAFAARLAEGRERLERFRGHLAAVAKPVPPDNPAAEETRSSPAGRRHTVRPGDTLSKISREYGVAVDDLREANGIAGDVIRAGQQLAVPDVGIPAQP